MIVKVRFFTRLREITGHGEESLELPGDSTVKMALEALSARHGTLFRKYITIEGQRDFQLQYLVNGRSVTQMQDLETKLADGDTLVVVPPIGGGRK